MGIWRRLVYSGCKAIGEREYCKLMMECGRRVFPWDYPETKAGQEALMQVAVNDIENEYCLKPASKRVNYQALRQPCPFFPLAIFNLSAPIFVEIQAITRVPQNNALLYLPNAEDVKQITKDSTDQPFWESLLQSEFSLREQVVKKKPMAAAFNIEYAILTGSMGKNPKMINLSNESIRAVKSVLEQPEPLGKLKILNSDLTLKLDRAPMRQPIGFITRGDYSQARGNGMGLGVIEGVFADRLRNNAKGNGVIALFRNPTSSMYHSCWLYRARQ